MTEERDDLNAASSSSAPMSPTLEEIAAQAAARARTALHHLTEVVAATDSVALLATLSSLRLTHAQGEEIDVDAFARWQAKLEFLTWLAGTKPSANTATAGIDAAVIERVEELLEQYFNDQSLAVAGSDGDGDPEVRSLQRSLLVEAMHVRGEGTPEMVQFLARGIYSQHADWFTATLGFTCDDAIEIADRIFALQANRLRDAYERGHAAADAVQAKWEAAAERAVESRSPDEIALVEAVAERGIEWVTSDVGGNEVFSRMREVRGFTVEELSAAVPDAVRKKVPAFLRFFSRGFGQLLGSPSPIELNPLVETPLLFEDNRYFLFVPALLWEAILNSPHYALIRDAQYRTIYDNARADWLEQQATEAFRRLWPDAQIGWSLAYGPNAKRAELDGLILRGNKAIIIECKWKSLTLVARRGDSSALRKDIAQSILNAFEQGRRARDYIRGRAVAEFTGDDGTVLKVKSQAVNEIVLLSVLGRGALSLIAANPLEARALGLFKETELPWALSLFDLLAVCRTMEFGAQVFDYARRRAAVIADGRFHLHDEWDLLEFYFAGALDTRDPQFANMNMVTFTGSGRDLERLVLEPSATVPESLRRRIHPKVRALLKYLDGLPDTEATDAAAFLLGLSDRQLQQMGEFWLQAEGKTKNDRQVHTVSALPTPGGGGFTILCGRGTEDESQRLEVLCLVNKYKHHAPIWLGIGAVPDGEATPFVVSLDARQWAPDPELDRLFPIWPLPGTAVENP